MRFAVATRVAALVALAVLLAVRVDAAAAAWIPPVEAPVGRAFDLGRDPFEAGRHRGVDLAAPPGTPVRAPCPGPVAVAGRVGSSGGVVTLRCGPWRVSHMPLATIAVRPGDTARPGALLGTLARPSGHAGLHLGVRRHGARFGYVDPARFFGATDLSPPPVPGGRPTRTPRLGPAPRPAPVRRPAPAPRPARVPQPDAPAGVVAGTRTAAAPGVVDGRRAAAPTAVVAGPRAAPLPGSSPLDGGGVAPWPAWAGLALALAGLGSRARRTPRTEHVARPVALPREVR